jgi:5,5'-dehydrodivanillate O-demethylase oxygenase subunit
MEPIKHIDYEHTGPDTSAGRLMRLAWHPVFVSEDLKPCRALPLKIMGQELTLYRSADGTARIIDGRCAHRGVLLSVGIVEGDCVRCRYHGWKFDASGQCVDQPAERKSFAAKVKIPSYPVEEYFGFIWTYLGEGPAPPLPRWPELEDFGRFHVVELRKWNYFHDLENTVDDIHQFWVHKEGVYQDVGTAGEIPEMTAEETDFGLIQSTSFSNGFVRKLAFFMPNTLYFSSGAGMLRGFKSFLWNVPVDDVSHKMFFLFIAAHLPPDVGKNVAEGVQAARQYLSELPPVEQVVHDVLSGKMRFEDIEDRPDLVLIEDGIMLLGQGVIPDRSKNRLGSSDAAISIMRRIYAREMTALNEGRPVKDFKKPEAATLARVDPAT